MNEKPPQVTDLISILLYNPSPELQDVKVKLTSPSTIPLKTAGSRGWNMWAPSMGLTFKAISTTCRDTGRGRMRDKTQRGE